MAKCWMTPGPWEPTANLWSWFWARSLNWLCGRECSSPWDQAKCLNLPATPRLLNWSTKGWLDIWLVLSFVLICFFFHCSAHSAVSTGVPVPQKHQCWEGSPGRSEALLWHCTDPLSSLSWAQGPGWPSGQSTAPCLQDWAARGEQAGGKGPEISEFHQFENTRFSSA